MGHGSAILQLPRGVSLMRYRYGALVPTGARTLWQICGESGPRGKSENRGRVANSEVRTKSEPSVSPARVSTAHSSVSGKPAPGVPVLRLDWVRARWE